MVVFIGAAGLVPVAFVHVDHLARVTGDAPVREKIGWIGEDTVKSAFGIFGGDSVEKLQAIALVEPNPALRLVICQTGSSILVSSGGNRAILLQFKLRRGQRRRLRGFVARGGWPRFDRLFGSRHVPEIMPSRGIATSTGMFAGAQLETNRPRVRTQSDQSREIALALGCPASSLMGRADPMESVAGLTVADHSSTSRNPTANRVGPRNTP